MVDASFSYVDAGGTLQPDTSFGKYEKTSDSPLTVKYTLNSDDEWSDGVPVTADDMLLHWAALGGNLNTINADQVKTDDATGLPKNTKGKVYFDSSSIGFSLVKKTPEIGDDNHSMTLSTPSRSPTGSTT